MKKIFYVAIVFFAISSVFGLNAQNKNVAVGKWKYEVAQAPYGYNKGVLEIKEVNEKLTGELSFISGEDLKLQKLTMRNDTIWANIYVESENVQIVAKINKLKMNGSVNTSMGTMSLEGDKIVDVKE